MYIFFNSLRIAALAGLITFCVGVLLAALCLRVPTKLQIVLEALFSLPLVLPPTVVGFLLLLVVGPRAPLGSFLLGLGISLTMNWQAALLASVVVSFPLMYRSALAAFRSFDVRQIQAALCLGKSRSWILWQLLIKGSWHGLIAGATLSFARALGEYGATQMLAGYIPGKSATISTTVYQLWRLGDMAGAGFWVAVNIGISLVVLALLSWQERRSCA